MINLAGSKLISTKGSVEVLLADFTLKPEEQLSINPVIDTDNQM